MRGKVIFVIGVAGCGKSTVAKAIAGSVSGAFLEGDAYHPIENVEAMRSGHALTDDMRWGWLQDLAKAAEQAAQQGTDVLVACSGLKQSYRDILRKYANPCQMIFLDGSKALILSRMKERKDHYMPVSLLDSQFDTLEHPSDNEPNILTINIDAKPEQIIRVATSYAFPGN